MPHTKRTCLARHVICLNRTLTTFENAMILKLLADGQVVFSKIFNFLHGPEDRSKAVLLLWFLTVLAVCVYTLVHLLC